MQAQRTIFLLVNPLAGSCDAQKVAKLADELSIKNGVKLDIHTLSAVENLSEIIKNAIAKKYDVIAVCGGDGSISCAAQSLIGSDAKLAIIPGGTANVLAKEVGVPLETEKALEHLFLARPQKFLDAMKIEGLYCLSHLSIGTYALVAKNVDQRAKKLLGRITYLPIILKIICQKSVWQFAIQIDGKKRVLTASTLLVLNTSRTGFARLKWADDVFPNDGKLELCVIKARGLIEYVRIFFGLLCKKQIDKRLFEKFSFTQSLTIENKNALPLRLDGEIKSAKCVSIFLVKNALTIV